MKYPIVLIAAILLFLAIPCISVVKANSSTVMYDNGDIFQAKEYGDAWFDLVSIEVTGDGKYITIILHYANNIPNSPDYGYGSTYIPLIFVDVNGDHNEDFLIFIWALGDGSFRGLNIYDSSWSPIDPQDSELLFQPGGNYIGVRIPYSILAPTSSVISVETNGFSWMEDDVREYFNYTIGNDTSITIDGDPSDWGAIGPSFTDPNEGYVPQEFDWGSFYTTDNMSLVGSETYLFHRLDTYGTVTTELNPGTMLYERLYHIYYDVDLDGNDDIRIIVKFGIGSEIGRGIECSWYNFTSGDLVYLDTSGWDWGEVFEVAVPQWVVNASAGDTIGIRVEAYPCYYLDYTGWFDFKIPRAVGGAIESSTVNVGDVLFYVSAIPAVFAIITYYKRRHG